MPTVDDLLGPEPTPGAPGSGGLPSVDDLLGPAPQPTASVDDFGRPTPGSSPEMDQYIAQSPLGRVLDAFGHGAAQGWGEGNLGLDQTTQDSLKKAGVLPDVSKGQGGLLRAFNEALIRPAASALDATLRAGGAAFGAAQAGVSQIGAELGAPGLGRDIAAIPEAFFGSPGGIGVHGPVDMPAARELGVIGEPEAVWKGTSEPTLAPESVVAANVHEAQEAAPEPAPSAEPAAVQSPEPVVEPPQQAAPAEPEAPMDVHGLARQIAPETFDEYDALSQHRDDLRQQVADQVDTLRQQAEAQAPHAAEIADLEDRLQDTTPRLAKKYQARLDALRPERDAFLGDDFTMGALTRDTPEISALRQQLMETDYRMRDLSPDVSDAYRQAAAQMPAEEAPTQPEQAPSPAAEETPAPLAEQQIVPASVQGELGTAQGEPVAAKAAIPLNIADEVSRKLQAAGRPADEADAAGRLTEAMWQTRADAFEGRKGSAQEMYAREAPEIRTGREGAPRSNVRGYELAQSSRELEQRSANSQTESPEFKRWFGNSKVVDENGGPLRVYHGTGADIGAFDIKMRGTNTREMDARQGFFFTDKPEISSEYADEAAYKGGANVIPAFVSMKNPLIIDHGGAGYDPEAFTKFIHDAEKGGNDGVIIRNTRDGMREGDEPGSTYIAFKPEQIKSATGNNGEFNHADPRIAYQGAQGKIRLTQDGRSVITLMKSANASTFMHEMGHDWLERMMQDGADPEAPQHMRSDADTVRSYLGLGDGDTITTRAHEKFARSFERYLMEGRAPTQALADVFAKFKAWLTTIYQTVTKLRAPINDDIRDVFDRLVTANPDERTAIVPEKESDGAAVEPKTPEGRVAPEAVTANLANLHETDLATTEPAEAAEVADHAEQEITRTIDKNLPRIADELKNSPTEPTAEDGGIAKAVGSVPEDGSGPVDASGGGGNAEQLGQVTNGSDRTAPNGDSARGRPDARQPAARSGSRAGATDEPAGPNEPFGPAATDLIDKAGNIRLDNLNQPEEVNQVIREAAAANDDFMTARRGVVSDAQVLDLADALGMRAADLNQRQIGQAFNAEQVMAARKLLIQSATAVREAMARAATGSDADVMAYGEARARHLMIQEQVSGITAEAGRALRAFRAIGDEGVDAKALGDFLQGSTGKTLFQLRHEAKLGASLDTPAKVSKFIHDSEKPSFGDMMMEYWINGLISGPATHTTYAVGNALLALWKAGPETGVAAGIGAVRRMVGDDGERVYGGEVGAGLYGILKGQRDGIRAAGEAIKSGMTTPLPHEALDVMSDLQRKKYDKAVDSGMTHEDAIKNILGINRNSTVEFVLGSKKPAIPGAIGEILRIPSRGVATIHSYFRAIGYSEAKSQLAYRQAASEGLSGNAFSARIADLEVNPPESMMTQARTAATDQTMMNGGGEFTRKVAELTNTPIMGVRLLKIVDPFVKIGSNVMTQALLERSPLGVLDPDIRANLMGRNGPIARDTQIARIAVGSALGAATIGLAAQGFITGGGPSDPREAAVWRMTGKQPYSVRIGDTWYGVHRLGPLAMVMGVGADMYEFGESMETKDAGKLGGLLVGSITKGLLNESFMRGPAELIQALEDPDRYGSRYIRDQLGTLLPFSTGMAQISRAMDPYAREARTTMDAIKDRVPWLSQTLLPRLDIWGQPIPNKDDLGLAGLSAIMESRVNNDPVNQALSRLNVFPAAPERKLVGIDLTDQQYDDYSRVAGRMAKMRLDNLVATPGFSALPNGIQSKVITDTIASSRRAAGDLLKMQNPQIIQQAVTNKRNILIEGRAAAKSLLPAK